MTNLMRDLGGYETGVSGRQMVEEARAAATADDFLHDADASWDEFLSDYSAAGYYLTCELADPPYIELWLWKAIEE